MNVLARLAVFAVAAVLGAIAAGMLAMFVIFLVFWLFGEAARGGEFEIVLNSLLWYGPQLAALLGGVGAVMWLGSRWGRER